MKKLLLYFNDVNSENVSLNVLNEYPGVEACCVFKSAVLPFRMLRRLHFAISDRGLGIWMLNWKNRLKNYDEVVCIASRYSGKILTWISRINPHAKLINYYWDQISVSGYPLVYSKLYENWTFNLEDSKRYGINYNPQYWVKKITIPKSDISYDISYVGADRNGTLRDRTALVENIYTYCKNHSISSYFWYVTSKPNDIPEISKTELLSENEFYQILSESKTVIELVENEKQWITLRTFFALTNNKKLITNNRQIVREKFYNPLDIFIIGEDDIDTLESFIAAPFQPIATEKLEYYEFHNWVNRF